MGGTPASTPAPTATGRTGRGQRLDALDGLRAIAVLAVLAYHGGIGGVRGGMFGVDAFFVLSGYLITTLLLAERAGSGTIQLRRFWARRARRLLPALALTVVGALALARFAAGGDSLTRVRGDALGALFYVSNWHLVLSGQGYFALDGAPSPLLHTWSLGVEEQFYVVWPLVVLGAALWAKRRHQSPARTIAWLALGGALASAALMAGLHAAGMSTSRLYYGTDTRAQALLAGAALAGVLASRALPAGRGRRAWSVVGWIGASGLAWLLFQVDGSSTWLYNGGFLLVAACGAAVVGSAVTRPDALLVRGLATRPMVAIGRISYGVYLYHWPIFLWLDGARTGLTGWSLFVVRLTVTFVVATLSWVALEQPVRRARLVPRAVRDTPMRLRPLLLPAATITAVLAVTVSMMPTASTGASTQLASAAGPIAAATPVSHAAPAAPVRALLVGDSLGVTLGEGLAVDSARWGVTVDQGAALGCDLDPQSTVDVMGVVGPAAQGCADWQTAWTAAVARDHPQVVLMLLGRWEVLDRRYNGRWTHVGEQPWDSHLRDELDQAIDTLSAQGATVVLLTLPYIQQTTEQPDGQPWDMNLPGRTDAFNAVLAAAAARRPGRAVVVDLNRVVDPAGRYTSVVDGVRVRNSDYEHFSVAGGEWLRSRLLPTVAAIGSAAESHSQG